MNVKVLGDAPAVAMANLYSVWAGRLGDSHQFAIGQDLLQSLIEPRQGEAPQSPGHDSDSLFAGMPAASFDWSEDGGKESGGGKDRDQHRPSGDTAGDAGLATALSLFKGFGHGDLDI